MKYEYPHPDYLAYLKTLTPMNPVSSAPASYTPKTSPTKWYDGFDGIKNRRAPGLGR